MKTEIFAIVIVCASLALILIVVVCICAFKKFRFYFDANVGRVELGTPFEGVDFSMDDLSVHSEIEINSENP